MGTEFKNFAEFMANGWQEYQGRTCLDAIICPHCGARSEQGRPAQTESAYVGEIICECGQRFTVRVVKTPLGMGWQTWDRDPYTVVPGKAGSQ